MTRKKLTQKAIITALCILTTCGATAGCKGSAGSGTEKTVVIYTSVDQVFSEKVFKEYEAKTGVKVKPVYDIEASKTVGLVNRLISEKSKPQADVFWNGEIIQTIVLKENGVLTDSNPSNAKDLPDGFVDKDKTWFAFGGRARVLLYNKTLISKENCPKTMEDLGKIKDLSSTGLAYPIFGTASTESAVLYATWGSEKAKAYYQGLKNAGISILDGNSVVKDYVSQKKLAMGLTDTDDAIGEMKTNKDLAILFLDQGKGQMGTLVTPNSVCKIKNGPNSEQADLFINYLLSAEVEQQLVTDDWIQIPAHTLVQAGEAVGGSIHIMAADFNAAYLRLEEAKADLTGIFIR